MIKFACPHCKKTLQVKDEFAGRKAACPACKKKLVVPAQMPAPATVKPAPKPATAPVDVEAMALAELSGNKEAEKPVATVDFTCPFCDAELHIGVELAGKQTPCPECRRIVKVPLVEKSGPRDWRKPEESVMPSGAKREDAPLEGAWGTQMGTRAVSSEALLEADVIKIEREPFLQREWVLFNVRVPVFVVAFGGGILLVAGLWFAWRSLRTDLEKDAVQMAEAYLLPDKVKGLSPPQQAELQRLLAEYCYRTGDPERVNLGRQRFALARQAAAALADEVEKQAILRELLWTQLELGMHVDDRGAEEMRETLRLVEPDAWRADVMRELARHAVKSGNSQAVSAMAGIFRGGSGTDARRIAALSTLGLELAEAGQVDDARQLALSAAPLYKADDPFPKPLLTLVVALKKPDLEELRKKLESHKDKDPTTPARMAAAQIEGQLRAGDLKPDVKVFEVVKETRIRVDALLSCAGVLTGAKSGDARPLLEEAAKLMTALSGEDALWQQQRLVPLALEAGDLAFAKQLSDGLPQGPIQSRARLAIFRARLAILQGAMGQSEQYYFDPSLADSLKDGPSAAHAVGLALLARDNARRYRGDAWDWAKNLEPDTLRPFAAAGVALGMRDRQKQ